MSLPIARLGNPVFTSGTYAYCGSAKGPGGLRARLARHCRSGKRLHWHIDHLGAAADLWGIVAMEDGNECHLRAALEAIPGASVPVPGFGSSDCQTCLSHLVMLPSSSRRAVRRRVAQAIQNLAPQPSPESRGRGRPAASTATKT